MNISVKVKNKKCHFDLSDDNNFTCFVLMAVEFVLSEGKKLLLIDFFSSFSARTCIVI